MDGSKTDYSETTKQNGRTATPIRLVPGKTPAGAEYQNGGTAPSGTQYRGKVPLRHRVLRHGGTATPTRLVPGKAPAAAGYQNEGTATAVA